MGSMVDDVKRVMAQVLGLQKTTAGHDHEIEAIKKQAEAAHKRADQFENGLKQLGKVTDNQGLEAEALKKEVSRLKETVAEVERKRSVQAAQQAQQVEAVRRQAAESIGALESKLHGARVVAGKAKAENRRLSDAAPKRTR